MNLSLPVMGFLAVFLGIGFAAAADEIAGVATVIDGDTIEVHDIRIRLHGIDAPESSQKCITDDDVSWRCGQKAALALSDHLGRSAVRCEARDRDRYGRIVAICFKGAESINRWTVGNGWAVAYRKYALDYVDDEDRARAARLNVWSGHFEMPWDWRASRRR